ncbi:hypothetical protein H010_24649 [Hydrogenophaga taeniospiralis CCUG 15921]|uniref:Putative regulatory protein FmdB zinc ribbon domain-containing protein n=1 Tax=Hydrogenophaga taeniospiralis CCUG 15921 TaxID=1281780 RepID=A0A9X4NX76_9BURK|nr:FmdB family zinc ribbon protein [Hydrogenophaga taeniospiralis]MDG5978464.1 hypothetical protein [Hydrogenophaga taeniospiralis CCUG 15921]
MPIYAYKCASCGHAKDVLQKMSDDPLSICPACGQASFQKQLTAAGFQLKGSGWYVTDFRGGNSGTTAPAVAGAENGASAADAAAKPSSESTTSPAAASPATPAASAAAPAASSPPTAST